MRYYCIIVKPVSIYCNIIFTKTKTRKVFENGKVLYLIISDMLFCKNEQIFTINKVGGIMHTSAAKKATFAFHTSLLFLIFFGCLFWYIWWRMTDKRNFCKHISPQKPEMIDQKEYFTFNIFIKNLPLRYVLHQGLQKSISYKIHNS